LRRDASQRSIVSSRESAATSYGHRDATPANVAVPTSLYLHFSAVTDIHRQDPVNSRLTSRRNFICGNLRFAITAPLTSDLRNLFITLALISVLLTLTNVITINFPFESAAQTGKINVRGSRRGTTRA